jgi:exopolysaccharide biosynthesis protein
VLLLLNLVSCAKNSLSNNNSPSDNKRDTSGVNDENYSGLTKILVDSTTFISNINNDTTFKVAQGVHETDIRYTNKKGRAMAIFILKVNLTDSTIRLEVATPNDKSTYATQTVLDMAEVVEVEDSLGYNVVAGINGDYYNVDTYMPMGVLIKNGTIIKDYFSNNSARPQQALSFFGMLNNGNPYIGYKNEYRAVSSRLIDATGGGMILIMNNKIVRHPRYASRRDPRTFLGYTKDGYLYMVIVDGRNIPYSNGMTYAHMSAVMKAFNVGAALTFDGGGSSTFITKNPKSGRLDIGNRPSGGRPRAVSNAWLVISKGINKLGV